MSSQLVRTLGKVLQQGRAAGHRRVLIDLHRLIREGKGDSPEADALRERLERNWHCLTEAQREEMTALSARLNDGEPLPEAAP